MAFDIAGSLDKATSAVNSLTSASGSNSNNPQSSQALISQQTDTEDTSLKERLKGSFGDRWFRIYPYQFIVEDSASKNKYIYTLPIPPSSMTLQPVMASRVTPTLSGMVEQTSAIRLWRIQFQGTTGISIGRGVTGSSPEDRSLPSAQFRSVISTTGMLTGLFDAAGSALRKLGNIADSLSAFSSVNSVGGAMGALANSAQAMLMPNLPYASSAVPRDVNGFTEIHHLHWFIYQYTRLKETNPDNWSMYFIDWKSLTKWRIIINGFSISRNADKPFLYNYSMSLEAWDMAHPGDQASGNGNEVNRFEGDLKTVNTLSITQTLNKTKGIFNKIKGW